MKYTNKFLGALCLAAFGFASCADDYSLLDHTVEKPASIEAYEYLNDYQPLKEYVSSSNPDFKLGTGITASDYNAAGMVYRLAASNFDELTAGNAMKHASVVADNGSMDFGTVSAFVSQAKEAGQTIYGHTLAWHAQQRNKYLNDLLKDREIPVDPDATETVVDFEFDYKTFTEYNYWGQQPAGASITVGENGLIIQNPTVIPEFWTFQYHITPGDISLAANNYKLTAKIKGSAEGSLTACLGSWGGQATGTLKFTTEWKEVTIDMNGVAESAANFVMLQSGNFAGTIELEWIKVTHEEAAAVNFWEELIINGDAEGDDFSSFKSTEVKTGGPKAPQVTEAGMGADGVGRAYKVVADAGGNGDNWDNQFFISAPEAFQMGDKYEFTMKYRADIEASSETQEHGAPGAYIHWAFIGSPAFSTEWKEYKYSGTIDNDGVQTIAFNLWVTKTPTVYYFDDISWKVERSGNTIPLTAAEKKDTITWAMNNWISGMMAATEGYVSTWDVVNEPISGTDVDGDGFYDLWSSKNSAGDGNFYYTDYLGDLDYVRTAVKQAREHYTGEAPLKLFINDFNLESDWDDNKKLKSLINWIEKWEEDGVTKIDGIGTQMHVSYHANAATQASKEAAIENMFELLKTTGKLIKISELDMGYVDANGNSVKTANMTEEQHMAMAEFYKFIIKKYFEILDPAQQYGITHWSPTDSPAGSGWRAEEPIGLWDANYNRKHVYAGFADGLAGK